MKPSSTRARLLSAMWLTTAVVAIPAVWFGHDAAYRQALERGRQDTLHLVSAMERPIAAALQAKDPAQLQAMLQNLASHPSLARALVVDVQGQPVAEARAAGVAAPAAGVPPTTERALQAATAAAEPLGRLVVHARQQVLVNQARRQADTAAVWIAGAALAIGALLAFLALQLVAKPLRRLARQMSRVAPGQDQRVSISRLHARDEFGIVARAANGLLDGFEERAQRERKLRQDLEATELQYRRVFGFAKAGSFVIDGGGRLLNCNATTLRLLGATDADTRRWREGGFIEHAFLDPSRIRSLVQEALEHQRTALADLELDARVSTTRWVHCVVSPSVQDAAAPDRGLVECVIVDITAMKKDLDMAAQRAGQDVLTGLKNREAAHTALDQCLARAASDSKEVCVVHIDLDGFKAVNERFGFAAGDHVLKECADRIRAMTRSSDIVARLGNAELLLVLDGLSATATRAQRMAADIVARLSEPILLRDGRMGEVGAAVGLASYPLHAAEREPLLVAAERAMRSAKRVGRNNVRVAELEPV